MAPSTGTKSQWRLCKLVEMVQDRGAVCAKLQRVSVHISIFTWALVPHPVFGGISRFSILQTSVQVPAPAAGVIEALLVPDGGKVEGGTPLFKLRKTGGESDMCNLHSPSYFNLSFSEDKSQAFGRTLRVAEKKKKRHSCSPSEEESCLLLPLEEIAAVG